MLKNRLIPVVLLRNGVVVQSKGFKRYQNLGNPVTIVQRLSDWCADELIYLDITREGGYNLRREDLINTDDIYDIIREIGRNAFMPLTIGGRVRNLTDIFNRLSCGADKVSLNTQAMLEHDLILKAAKEFGSQCICISIDVKRNSEGNDEVFIEGGRMSTGKAPEEWAREAEDCGAGEILLNSIDRDGAGLGYDLELIARVSGKVSIPVIAMGGVGQWRHFEEGIRAGATAVAAANIFQYSENSLYEAKKYLFEAGLNFRNPTLGVEEGQAERITIL